MADRHEAPQPADTDPFIGTIVSLLTMLLAVVLALAAGLTWKSLLHWTGELLLIIGILLAAKGISDVRREWTGRPGFWGSVKQKAQAIGVQVASFLWVRWNRAVKKSPRLAKRLHLRDHETPVYSRDAMASPEAAMATATIPAPGAVREPHGRGALRPARRPHEGGGPADRHAEYGATGRRSRTCRPPQKRKRAARMAEDQGRRPAPVMVWSPAQCGAFLDSIEAERLYALYHLAAY